MLILKLIKVESSKNTFENSTHNRTQTYNLLGRNQVLYSFELYGYFNICTSKRIRTPISGFGDQHVAITPYSYVPS